METDLKNCVYEIGYNIVFLYEVLEKIFLDNDITNYLKIYML